MSSDAGTPSGSSQSSPRLDAELFEFVRAKLLAAGYPFCAEDTKARILEAAAVQFGLTLDETKARYLRQAKELGRGMMALSAADLAVTIAGSL